MMDKNFDKILQFVLKREGGYVNDPNDLGGETNKGITYKTYNAYRKSKNLPARSVKYITDSEVKEIYYNNYYKAVGADKIKNPKLAAIMFDTAVNMGVSRAKTFLQKSNGNTDKFIELRRAKYKEFVKAKPSQKKFLQGWNNRVNELNSFIGTLENSSNDNSNFSNNNVDLSNNFNKVLYGGITYEQSSEQANYVIQINNMYQELLNEQSNEGLFYTREQIDKMSTDEYLKNEPMIMEQLKTQGGIPSEKQLNQQNNFLGFINQISGNSNIFTREDIKNMSTDEYLKNEKAIDFQLKTIGIPSQVQANQAVQSGGMIYVQPYTRADGTEVKGYYRSTR